MNLRWPAVPGAAGYRVKANGAVLAALGADTLSWEGEAKESVSLHVIAVNVSGEASQRLSTDVPSFDMPAGGAMIAVMGSDPQGSGLSSLWADFEQPLADAAAAKTMTLETRSLTLSQAGRIQHLELDGLSDDAALCVERKLLRKTLPTGAPGAVRWTLTW